jgi:hypothetical protein
MAQCADIDDDVLSSRSTMPLSQFSDTQIITFLAVGPIVSLCMVYLIMTVRTWIILWQARRKNDK